MYQRKDFISLVDAQKQLSALANSYFQEREILRRCINLEMKIAIAWTYSRPLRKLDEKARRSRPIQMKNDSVVFMLNERMNKLLDVGVKEVSCSFFSLNGIQPYEDNYQELRVSSSRDIATDRFLERDIKTPLLLISGASEQEKRIAQNKQRETLLRQVNGELYNDNQIPVSFTDLLISLDDFERLKLSVPINSVPETTPDRSPTPIKYQPETMKAWILHIITQKLGLRIEESMPHGLQQAFIRQAHEKYGFDEQGSVVKRVWKDMGLHSEKEKNQEHQNYTNFASIFTPKH